MTNDGFDRQPELASETLALRPLRNADFEALRAAASDPRTWAGHPAKDRHMREVFAPYFDFLLQTESTLVVTDRREGRVIGCSRYYTAPDAPGTISIGFTFLDCAYWGGNTNFEMKRLMFDHAFARFDDVWFHIDPTNLRSQKATAKLGATHEYDAELDLAGAPARWMCFRLRKADWRARLMRSEQASRP